MRGTYFKLKLTKMSCIFTLKLCPDTSTNTVLIWKTTYAIKVLLICSPSLMKNLQDWHHCSNYNYYYNYNYNECINYIYVNYNRYNGIAFFVVLLPLHVISRKQIEKGEEKQLRICADRWIGGHFRKSVRFFIKKTIINCSTQNVATGLQSSVPYAG